MTNSFRVGDKIDFGNYLWRILEVDPEKALVITDEIIEQRAFHNAKGPVTWSGSELRQYLNGTFYESFSSEDRARIILVKNRNKDNPWYGSDGGDDTEDMVFLLSIEEAVCKYFGDSSKCLNDRSPKQRYWFQKKDDNNLLRKARFNETGWWWWLRSPGRDNRRAVYVHGDGNIGIQGNGTYNYSSRILHPMTKENSGGVRPVLWLKLL